MQSNIQPDRILQTYIDGIKQQNPSEQQDLEMQQKLFASIDNYAEQQEQSAKNEPARSNWLQAIGAFLTAKPKLNQYCLLGSMALACVLAVGLFVTSSVNSPAFASVIEKLEQISSMVYKGKMKSNGRDIMQLEVYYQAPSQLRIENSPVNPDGENQPAIINILDTSIGQGLILMPANKMAMPFDFSQHQMEDTPENNPLYWLDSVKQYQGEIDVLERKSLNNQEVLGYQIYVSNMSITLWVNVNTEWPVQIEIMMDKVNGQSPFEFVADVEFNQQIDASLFSMQADDDYKTVSGDE